MSSLDIDVCIEKLYAGEKLSAIQIQHFCQVLKEELMKEENICVVQTPVSIVGDVHGQFYDLLELFKVGGKCPDVNYLFLGDYVDRGYYSVQTMSLLICLRIRYPGRITLLRGNHETRQVTQIYGFYSECVRTYGSADVWESFVTMFDYLSIAAIVGNSIFCVHGGLSPSIDTIDQIAKIDRKREIPHEGDFSDLMWSDPDPDPHRYTFRASKRGCGHLFGKIAVKAFNRANNFTNIVRSHQLCMDGYQDFFDGALTTVWSAPNYCYRCGNVAAIMEISEEGEQEFNIFMACPANERKSLDLETNHIVPQYFL